MSIAEQIRAARVAAGLSQQDVAEHAGLDVRTIRNIEQGVVTPSPDSLQRLRAVKQLALPEPAAASGPDLVPNAYLAPHHDALRLYCEMTAALQAGGCAIEQTWLYCDGKSAADWSALSNSGEYALAFRESMPVRLMAEAVGALAKARGLDVHSIGAGDGKSETRLLQYLCDLRGGVPDLRLTLLDISPPLVHAAYRHAADALERRGVAVFAMVGDFLELRRIPVLSYRPAGSQRRRLYTLLGCTWQNLADELGFLRQLAECAAPGDLVALDVRKARAPAGDVAAIQAAEPVLTSGPPRSHHEWLSGPIRRYCEGWADIRFCAQLQPRGVVPGSYEIDLCADVAMRSGETRRYTVVRGKSYEPEQLATALDALHWRTLQQWPYGLREPSDHVLMLLERR